MTGDIHTATSLFLVRHAQSGNNAQHESRRVPDPGITELGHRQAQGVAEFLSSIAFESILCSAFRRALQTADYLRKSIGKHPEIVIDMHEHGGCYQGWNAENIQGQPGMTGQEIVAEFGSVQLPENYPDQGWWGSKPRESHPESNLRAERMSGYLCQRLASASGNLVCVSHADFLAKLFLAMFGESIQHQAEFYDLKNVGVTQVTHSGKEWQLIELNSVDFLPEELVSS